MSLQSNFRLLVGLVAVSMASTSLGENGPPIDDSPGFEDGMALVDVRYAWACGPIAGYVAARKCGIEITLDELATRCRWKPGQGTSLNRIREALQSTNQLRVTPVIISPDELVATLQERECSVVLAVREESEFINHAVCAVGANEDGVQLVDYPELNKFWRVEDLQYSWDGAALLVERKMSFQESAMAVLSGLLILFGFLVAHSLVLKQGRTAKAAALLLPALSVFFSSGLSAEELVEKPLQVAQMSWDRSFHVKELDLGNLDSMENRVVEIQITNDLGESISIDSTEASCGCVNIKSVFDSLDRGGTGSLIVEFRTAGKRGQVSQQLQLVSANKNNVFRIELKASIKSMWAVPENVIIEGRSSRVKTSKVPSSSVTVNSVGYGGRLTLDSVQCGSDAFDVQFEPSEIRPDLRGSKQQGLALGELRIAMKKGRIPSSDVSSVIELRFSNSLEEPTAILTIPVRFRLPLSEESLGRISFGAIRDKSADKEMEFGELQVQADQLRFATDHDEISAVVETSSGGKSTLRVTFERNDATEPGFFKGRLSGTVSGKEVMTVDYFGVILARASANQTSADPAQPTREN